MSEENERICFVVSPIGEDGSEVRRRADQVLKHIIIPCVKECGFSEDNVVRADKISNPGAITHQIIHYIINSDLVIADLTGLNPNVFYELAIRHVLRKPYVQICDINTTLPFDVKNQRTIMFDYKDLDSVQDAMQYLKKYIVSALQSPEQLMTPIHEGLVLEGLLHSEKPSDQLLGELVNTVGDLTGKIVNIENILAVRQTTVNKDKIMTEEIFNTVLNGFKSTVTDSQLTSIRTNPIPPRPVPRENRNPVPIPVPKPPTK